MFMILDSFFGYPFRLFDFTRQAQWCIFSSIMLEQMVFGAIDGYQNNLDAQGLKPVSSEMVRLAVAEDGWPGFWEKYKGIVLGRACKLYGVASEEEVTSELFIQALALDVVQALRVLVGNNVKDEAWLLLQPAPTPAPQRRLEGVLL